MVSTTCRTPTRRQTRRTRRRTSTTPRTRTPQTLFTAQHFPLQTKHPLARATRTVRYVNLKPCKRAPHALPSSYQEVVLPKAIAGCHPKRPQPFYLFYFVHVPKTGGVALKDALYEAHGVPSHSTANPNNVLLRGQGKPPRSYTRLLNRGHLSARDIDPRVPTVCVLRDPYERVKSAFRYLKEGAKHAVKFLDNEAHTKRLMDTHGIERIADLFTHDPKTGTYTPKHRAARTVLERPHMRLMSDFVTDTHGKLIVDHVFRLESLDDAHERRNIAAALHVPPFEMRKSNQSRFPYTLSDEDKACIRSWWAADFFLFG